MREINRIRIASPRIRKPLTLALCPDLHDGDWQDVRNELAGCDAILIAGDLVERHRGLYQGAVRFLQEAPELAPTFYALGNHERKFKQLSAYWPHVERSRVTVLDNRYVLFGGIALGGLSSARKAPDTAFLHEMAAREEFRLLMCHHPEYYRRYVKPFGLDLTVSGHAHGGQIRIGSQGLYAPGQGILPRLTSGFYEDGRLLVSRGMTDSTWAPRINCRCELMLLELTPE